SATAGFLFEIPTFALGARALRHDGAKTGVEQDLASAAITLGLLKSFSFLGSQASRKIPGMQTGRMAKASEFALNQGATFAGLLAAHRIEERVGLRQHVDNATTV